MENVLKPFLFSLNLASCANSASVEAAEAEAAAAS